MNYVNPDFNVLVNKRLGELKKELKKYSGMFEADISILFNALEEEKFGEIFLNYDSVKTYADSGGLQLALYGEKKYGDIEARKSRIFETQAKFADFGFNFDTIPIEKVEYQANNKVNLTERVYNDDRIMESVCATIRSLKKQAKYFNEHPEHNSKIMLIAQGNTVETYKLYVETIWKGIEAPLSELGQFIDFDKQSFIDEGILKINEANQTFWVSGLAEEEQNAVGGLAVSSACMGAGSLQRFELAYVLGEIDIDPRVKKHIHILGAGTAKLLIPFLVSPDYFSFIERLSFDSTTHTRKYSFMGAILDEDYKETILPKESIAYVRHFYKPFWERNKDYFQSVGIMTKDEMLENCTHHSPLNEKGTWSFTNKEDAKYSIGTSLLAFLVFCDYIVRFYKKFSEVEIFKGPDNIKHFRMKHPQDEESFEFYRNMFISKYGLTNSGTITKSQFEKQIQAGVNEDEW
jgi:hypothetical protein